MRGNFLLAIALGLGTHCRSFIRPAYCTNGGRCLPGQAQIRFALWVQTIFLERNVMKRFLMGFAAMAIVITVSASEAKAERGRRRGNSQLTYAVPATYVVPTYVAPVNVAPAYVVPTYAD